MANQIEDFVTTREHSIVLHSTHVQKCNSKEVQLFKHTWNFVTHWFKENIRQPKIWLFGE